MAGWAGCASFPYLKLLVIEIIPVGDLHFNSPRQKKKGSGSHCLVNEYSWVAAWKRDASSQVLENRDDCL